MTQNGYQPSVYLDRMLTYSIKICLLFFLILGILVLYRVYNSYSCFKSASEKYICRSLTYNSGGSDYSEELREL